MSDVQLQNLVGGVVIAAILAWLAWRWWWRKPLMRRLVAVPVTKLSGAGEGQILRVVGVIQGHGVRLRGPLTGLRGAWYYTGVYESRQVGSYRRGGWIYWDPVLREQQGFDFYIDDGSAVARVRGDCLRVLSQPDLERSVGWLMEPDESERRYLERNRVQPRDWFGLRERTLRIVETVLEPGDRVAVVGQVRFADPGEEGRVYYEIGALPEGYVLISDERKALA